MLLNRCSTITAREISEISKDNGCCREDPLTAIIIIVILSPSMERAVQDKPGVCQIPLQTMIWTYLCITCCFRMHNSRGTWRSHFAPCTGVKNWTEEGYIKLWVRCWFGVFRWQPQCPCYIYSRQTSVAQERWTGHKYYESKIPHEQQKYKEALLKHGHYFVPSVVVYHMKMILYKIYWKMILGLVMHWSSPFQCLANCTTNSKRLPLPPLMSVFQATMCHRDWYEWFLKN